MIARYLTAEAEAQKEQPASIAVTPANYKFKYNGRGQLDGRDVHVFQVTPREEAPGPVQGRDLDRRRHLPARAGIRLPGQEPLRSS